MTKTKNLAQRHTEKLEAGPGTPANDTTGPRIREIKMSKQGLGTAGPRSQDPKNF